jgi:hypothetical protein
LDRQDRETGQILDRQDRQAGDRQTDRETGQTLGRQSRHEVGLEKACRRQNGIAGRQESCKELTKYLYV